MPGLDLVDNIEQWHHPRQGLRLAMQEHETTLNSTIRDIGVEPV